MATQAGNIGVTVGQRKTDRRGGVVDRYSEPTVESMATFASLRELAADVVWHVPAHRLSLLIILQVTRDTSGRQPLELPDRRTFMTIFALHCGVGSQKWKAVPVIFHLLNGNFPALNRVAIRAIRAHFSLMNVRVAVLAIFAHIRENGLHVALCALHSFVHSSEWVLCLVVVELGNCLDGTPSGGCVAVFTRDRERTVRTSRALPLKRWSWSTGWLPSK